MSLQIAGEGFTKIDCGGLMTGDPVPPRDPDKEDEDEEDEDEEDEEERGDEPAVVREPDEG